MNGCHVRVAVLAVQSGFAGVQVAQCCGDECGHRRGCLDGLVFDVAEVLAVDVCGVRYLLGAEVVGGAYPSEGVAYGIELVEFGEDAHACQPRARAAWQATTNAGYRLATASKPST